MALDNFTKSNEDFEAFYGENLNDLVRNSEELRLIQKEELKKTMMSLSLKMGIVGIVAVVISFLFNSYFPIGFVSVVFMLIYVVVREKHRLIVLDKVKRELIPPLLSYINPSFKYKAVEKIKNEEFKISKLFSTFDTYKGDDLIVGRVGETRIKFSEVNAIKEVDDDKNISVFHGLFFIVDFNKDFDGDLFVLPKRFTGRTNSKLKRLGKHEMDSARFNEEYFILSEDAHLARYILTPVLMENILEFSDRTSIQPIISFRKGVMFLGINTMKNSFSISLNEEINKQQVKDYFDDINLALQLIDELDLNLRIWNKI